MRIQLPLALLVLPAAACTDTLDDGAPDTDDVAAQVELDNGGYTPTDEAPEFASAELFAAASIEADVAVADPMATDPEILALEGIAAVHNVVVLWGRMPGDAAARGETARDWSGELRISRGGLVVRRRIGFEDATDRVELRTERAAISFSSTTGPFSDGLAVIALDPTPDDPEPLTLTYTSSVDASISFTIDLTAAAEAPVVIDAGEGNKIIAVSRRRHADPCDAGFMRGRWHALAPNLGVFLGVVANTEGEPVGHVRGVFGQRRDGDRVLFAKFINREGGFRGILSGSFERNRFEARWIDRGGDRGASHGVFFEGATLRAGAWAARWSEASCLDRR